jgi:hypothetical protein
MRHYGRDGCPDHKWWQNWRRNEGDVLRSSTQKDLINVRDAGCEELRHNGIKNKNRINGVVIGSTCSRRQGAFPLWKPFKTIIINKEDMDLF